VTDLPLHPMYYPKPDYPDAICYDCGIKHGRKRARWSSWSMGVCGWCGQDTNVTEPRDYGWPKWSERDG